MQEPRNLEVSGLFSKIHFETKALNAYKNKVSNPVSHFLHFSLLVISQSRNFF